MNKLTQALAMTGMAVVAGAMMGAGSASAAPAGAASSTQSADHGRPGHDRVVGYFRNAMTCHKAGRIGELRHRWDDHDCNRVRFGVKHGWWALSVSTDDHGHGHNNNGGNNNNNNGSNNGNDHHGGMGNGHNNGGPSHH
jgi:hypothetical protein